MGRPWAATLLLVSVLGATAALTVACGDDEAEDATPTPTTAPAFGDPPALGTHVTEVIPAHGQAIRQAATRTLDERLPQPPCFAASFAGLEKQALWFRVLLDGVEVTTSLTWVVSENEVPVTKARGCIATEEGLAPGRHSVSVRVQDPDVRDATPINVITWSFDVVP